MFDFRPLTRRDFPLLATWLARPHVRTWWNHDPSPDAVEDDFGDGVDGADPVEYSIAAVDGVDVGFIQRYEIGKEQEWIETLAPIEPFMMATSLSRCLGVDYFVADPERTGQGLGTEMISEYVELAWQRYPSAESVIVDVDRTNRASWRALERVGFRRIWSGRLPPEFPGDTGLVHVYELRRPPGAAGHSTVE